MKNKRLYFDQAATSWPKLPSALQAASQFLQECGATSGRGAYASARQADAWLSRCRVGLARLVGASGHEDIALCSSGTHALNALLLGLLEPGDQVLTTDIEHNSVLRPLEQLRRARNVGVSVVRCDGTGHVDLNLARQMLEQFPARAVVISHASNVTGRRQDIDQWSQLAHSFGALLIVDASQTLGYVPVSMQEAGIDALATAGHKGLGGMPGTGFIAASQIVRAALRPIMFGGTGTASEQLEFVPCWPQSVEVGNLNLPAAVSLAVAAETWLERGEQAMQAWQAPLHRLLSGLRDLETQDRLRVIGHFPGSPTGHLLDWLPIVSLKLPSWDIHDFSAVLDAGFGVETRAGFHCAARIHQSLDTHSVGGTLRISLGHETSDSDVDDLLRALHEVL